jgi:methanogenic corrinoid protein MtbC1
VKELVSPEMRLGMTAAAVAGDSGRLYSQVAGLLDEGIAFDTVLFDVLVPLEQELGSRWAQGDYLVPEEHAATAAIETVVSILAGAFDVPMEARHVVVAAAEGDLHSLPGRMISAYLVFAGYRTTFLGADVPAHDLSEYLALETPEALILSCSMSIHLLGARAAIREAHKAHVPVLAGGRGFGPSGVWAHALGADEWVASLRSTAETIERWKPDTMAAETRAADPSPDLLLLLNRRTGILADARSAITLAERSGSQLSRLENEASLLLSALQAALLVNEHEVVTDMIRWQRTTLATQGVGDYDLVLNSISQALGSGFQAAGEFLSTASSIA